MKFNIRFYFSIVALSLVTLTSSANAQTIFASWDTWADSTIVDGLDADFSIENITATTVSYTHLTLPTILLV